MEKWLVNGLRIAESCRTCTFRKRTVERKMKADWICEKVDAEVNHYTVCDLYECSERHIYVYASDYETSIQLIHRPV